MSLSRSVALALLNALIAAAAAAALLIHFLWRNESWANYARLGLLVVGVASLMGLYRLGQSGFFPVHRFVSANWRRVALGMLIILASYPWTLLVGLGLRYRLLPDNMATGVVLLAVIVVLVIAGLSTVIQGFLGRR